MLSNCIFVCYYIVYFDHIITTARKRSVAKNLLQTFRGEILHRYKLFSHRKRLSLYSYLNINVGFFALMQMKILLYVYNAIENIVTKFSEIIRCFM